MDKRSLLQLRASTFRAIRAYFDAQGFIEVDTPLMVSSPDTEPSIEPFQTTWKDLGESHTTYLTPSPEFLIKRLLSEGSGNVYQLSHVFRNCEPSADKHNPEFMMLEWYRTNASYIDIMKDTEKLVRKVAIATGVSTGFSYQGSSIELQGSWERLSVAEAFKRYAAIDPDTLIDESALILEATNRGYQTQNTGYDDAFYQIFLNEIEDKLGFGRPTFLYDYPVSQAALARKKGNDPRYAERFELYIAGIELANAFSELTDWKEQETRLQKQVDYRKQMGQPVWEYDRDFVLALKHGLPAAGGIALGVDRLIMLLADSPDIVTVLPFSTGSLFQGASSSE